MKNITVSTFLHVS
jgi:hypothetical protein